MNNQDNQGIDSSTGPNGRIILRIRDDEKSAERQYAAWYIKQQLGLEPPVERESGNPEGLFLTPGLKVELPQLDSVFETVSLAREQRTGRRDFHGRFDDDSVVWEYRKPVISELLTQWRSRLTPEADRLAPPRFTVYFSHDVDRVTFNEPVSILKSLFPLHSAGRGNVAPVRALRNPDLLATTIGRLLDLESEYGVRAWFFMLVGPYGVGPFSTRYHIRWHYAQRIIDAILKHNAYIGLHSSYHARDRNSYRAEVETLSEAVGQKVVAHRNHYLRFDPVRHWHQLAEAGVEYDFSVGYPYKAGFRAGVVGPFQPYDFVGRAPSPVVEIPLIYMERPNHVRTAEQTLRELRELLNAARVASLRQGAVSVQIHPEKFALNGDWYQLYRRIIEACLEMGADVSGRLPENGRTAVGTPVRKEGR